MTYHPVDPDLITLMTMAAMAGFVLRRRGDHALADKLATGALTLEMTDDGEAVRLMVDGEEALTMPGYQVRNALAKMPSHPDGRN